jgi:hypothetical protein
MNLVFGNTFGTDVRRDAEVAALARLNETHLLLPPCCRIAVISVADVADIGQDPS